MQINLPEFSAASGMDELLKLLPGKAKVMYNEVGVGGRNRIDCKPGQAPHVFDPSWVAP